MARKKALTDPEKEVTNALIPVSPSEESTAREGLNQDGETGKEQEEVDNHEYL